MKIILFKSTLPETKIRNSNGCQYTHNFRQNTSYFNIKIAVFWNLTSFSLFIYFQNENTVSIFTVSIGRQHLPIVSMTNLYFYLYIYVFPKTCYHIILFRTVLYVTVISLTSQWFGKTRC